VDDVIGFMDGVSLTSECSSEPVVQNSMCSGYHSDTMVNNLLAYAPDVLAQRIYYSKYFAIHLKDGWHMQNAHQSRFSKKW
jgi:hypothetical protein